MVDARLRKETLGGEVGNAAETARFLVHRARNFDGARKIRIDVHEHFRRDDGSGEAALHVAGAASIDAAVLHDAGIGVDRPAFAGLHHVDMRVEMHRGAVAASVEPGNDVGARVAVRIARRVLPPDELGLEAPLPQPVGDEFGAGRVGFAGRVHRRKADQVGCEGDEFVAAVVDGAEELFVHRRY